MGLEHMLVLVDGVVVNVVFTSPTVVGGFVRRTGKRLPARDAFLQRFQVYSTQ